MKDNIIHADWIAGLQQLEGKSINCCITSPPYYGLRDYGVAGQIGLEETPEIFIQKLVDGFREVRRVLRDDGTLWVNIGDSYTHTTTNTQSFRRDKQGYGGGIDRSKRNSKRRGGGNIPRTGDLKTKDLIGIPWMLAFALRADGWYLRQDIIWHKPNPMPESVTDRCTKSHEYIFLFSKSPRYYYDADSIREDRTSDEDSKTFRGGSYVNGNTDNSTLGKRTVVGNKRVKIPNGWDISNGSHGSIHKDGRSESEYQEADAKPGRNKRSVWTVATQPFPESHFATFPEKLVVDMIKAGCPEDGIVLDPFFGAGTTGLVARKLNRHFIGIELNQNYIIIATKRLREKLGLFACF